eukprot:1192202-Prorocentrum_minimum.AAC.2
MPVVPQEEGAPDLHDAGGPSGAAVAGGDALHKALPPLGEHPAGEGDFVEDGPARGGHAGPEQLLRRPQPAAGHPSGGAHPAADRLREQPPRTPSVSGRSKRTVN